MPNSPLQPPVPFSDFEFAFDPSLSNLFPNPPPLPSSADLFSAAETTDLLGFLDNFSDFSWDVGGEGFVNPESLSYEHSVASTLAPYSNPHLNTAPEGSTSTRPRASTRSGSSRGAQEGIKVGDAVSPVFGSMDETTPSSSSTTMTATRAKSLLSTPQKRLNHIMSEQKRRNAIRDGYAQLIALLAPAGTAPGIGMPTRGRPKGSGSRGKGQSKGKSGVLFRAVEYCRWLEEGRDALRDEVGRVEAAAGIH